MCGRYRLTAKERYIRGYFGLDEDVEWLPRWNIAPTQHVLTIRQGDMEPRHAWAMVTSPARVADLPKPFDARLMRWYSISRRVNRVESDDAECAREVPQQSTAVQTLF